MTTDQKRVLVERFAGIKVLVVGDLMLDAYVWGDVSRVSPEAPVPVVEMRRRTHICGGAGNVAANLAALGAVPLVAGVVGDDADAETLRACLAEGKISSDGLVVAPARPTTTKLRVMAHGQQIVRVDNEQRSALDEGVTGRLLESIERQIRAAAGCVISDYGKGVVSPAVVGRVIELATAAGKPVVVDPKGTDFSKYRGATVVTPNVKEAGAVFHRDIESDEELADTARALVELLGGSVIVTRGERGMTVLPAGGEALHIPAMAKNVYDVTGAGDTVVGVLISALAAGAGLADAATLANVAAGIVVGKLGTAVVTAQELLSAEAG